MSLASIDGCVFTLDTSVHIGSLGGTQHYVHVSKLFGVLLYTFLLLILEVVPLDPLVRSIPNRVKLIFYEDFKLLPLSHWKISRQPKGICVGFPLCQGMTF
jgi:hypothetical protein